MLINRSSSEKARLSFLAGAAGLVIVLAIVGCGFVGVCHAASVRQPPDDQVISVYARLDDNSLRLLGSGVVVTRSGHIVTAAHVIDPAWKDRLVVVSGNSISRAQLAAADAAADLALLIAAPAVGQPAKLSDTPKTASEQTVYAVGASSCRLGPASGHVPWFFTKILGPLRSKPGWSMADKPFNLAGGGLFAPSDDRLVGLTIGDGWTAKGKERVQFGTAVSIAALRRFLEVQRVPGYAKAGR